MCFALQTCKTFAPDRVSDSEIVLRDSEVVPPTYHCYRHLHRRVSHSREKLSCLGGRCNLSFCIPLHVVADRAHERRLRWMLRRDVAHHCPHVADVEATVRSRYGLSAKAVDVPRSLGLQGESVRRVIVSYVRSAIHHRRER